MNAAAAAVRLVNVLFWNERKIWSLIKGIHTTAKKHFEAKERTESLKISLNKKQKNN